MKIVIWLFYFIAVYCEYNIILIIDKKISIYKMNQDYQKAILFLKIKNFLKSHMIIFAFMFGFAITFI